MNNMALCHTLSNAFEISKKISYKMFICLIIKGNKHIIINIFIFYKVEAQPWIPSGLSLRIVYFGDGPK